MTINDPSLLKPANGGINSANAFTLADNFVDLLYHLRLGPSKTMDTLPPPAIRLAIRIACRHAPPPDEVADVPRI